MKDYLRYAKRIEKMAKWRDIHNCGYPSRDFPVNLYFELAQNPACRMYLAYDFGMWRIDYTLDANIKYRTKMNHSAPYKTDREMYEKVQEIINLFME